MDRNTIPHSMWAYDDSCVLESNIWFKWAKAISKKFSTEKKNRKKEKVFWHG